MIYFILYFSILICSIYIIAFFKVLSSQSGIKNKKSVEIRRSLEKLRKSTEKCPEVQKSAFPPCVFVKVTHSCFVFGFWFRMLIYQYIQTKHSHADDSRFLNGNTLVHALWHQQHRSSPGRRWHSCGSPNISSDRYLVDIFYLEDSAEDYTILPYNDIRVPSGPEQNRRHIHSDNNDYVARWASCWHWTHPLVRGLMAIEQLYRFGHEWAIDTRC